MKPSLDVIKGLVKKHPSDKQLGAAVRIFIKEFFKRNEKVL